MKKKLNNLMYRVEKINIDEKGRATIVISVYKLKDGKWKLWYFFDIKSIGLFSDIYYSIQDILDEIRNGSN